MKKIIFKFILTGLIFLLPIKANAVNQYVPGPKITLIINAVDEGSGVKKIKLGLDPSNLGEWEEFKEEHVLNIEDLPEGIFCVYCELKDGIGNVSEVISACAVKDSVAPTGTIKIIIIINFIIGEIEGR